MEAELKNSLREIIPLDSGGSFKLLWDMLYHIRLLKYFRQSDLKIINSRYAKICSVKKLDKLVELGLLKNTDNNSYVSTQLSLEILKEVGYNTKLVPKNFTGEGSINELNNTAVFIQALKLPDFKTLLYPSFEYIKPDALLVRANDKGYKLEFLEIEASKTGWDDWLEKKRISYLRLAQDRQVYAYWKDKCYHLGLTAPEIKDFKFSVSFICKLKKDFGTGFNFVDSL